MSQGRLKAAEGVIGPRYSYQFLSDRVTGC